ncbi:MAG: glycosyltransferase family 4 protein [Myxococcales bacterium]|nr:glycosyltransferase family 4 protein [Myxococcales bacterium]
MRHHAWIVINQSQSPSFQRLLGKLTESLGPCLLITGMPHPNSSPLLTIMEGPSYDRRSKSARLRSWSSFMLFATRKMVEVRGRPLVFTVTNPPMLPHLGLSLSKLRGWSTGILVWDLYPEHIVQQGWMAKSNPLVRCWSAVNRQAYRRSSATITIGEGMARAIRVQAKDPSLPISVIPNWANTKDLRPLARSENDFAKKHCSPGSLTVLYSGNIGASHSLNGLLQAAKQLSTERAAIEFLIVGSGLQAEALAAEAKQLELANLKMLPYQPWKTLPLSLASGDIAVVSQASSTSHLSVPSKTYSAMAVGSAILALSSPDSDLARMVREHRVGLVCDPDNSQAIAEALRELTRDSDRLLAMKRRSREVAERFYSEEVVEKRFLELLAPLVTQEDNDLQ